MRFTIILRVALVALKANLGRSLLTILGIVIGIVAIVMVVSLGQGANQLIVGQLEAFGGNFIIIRPGRQPEGPTDIAESILGDSLKTKDVEALAKPNNVSGVLSIEPAVLVPGAITYLDNIYRPLIFGWTTDALADLFNIQPVVGTYFTDEDIRGRAKIIVLGSKVKKELFGDSDAIGQFVKVRGHNLRVVGVLGEGGQVSTFNIDEIVIMPYTTAQKDILGIDYFHEVFVRTDLESDPEIVASDIRATLRALHDISNSEKDDFFVWTQKDIIERVGSITQILTIFLVVIASISLVVGGVGIMNIMLVSVTERTREIGLRKAIGATNQDILKQFLSEAIMLTAAGGVLGTLLALILVYTISLVVRQQYGIAWPLSLPVSAIALGVGLAVVVGVIFGIYPARKAAMKDPMEALRYE